ncbi:MAG: cell wall-binding repeat-containing protein [Actinomycetota bacterium]|nr:cell wall-binding repeat-containing protein [Actinomycetota bacterium]
MLRSVLILLLAFAIVAVLGHPTADAQPPQSEPQDSRASTQSVLVRLESPRSDVASSQSTPWIRVQRRLGENNNDVYERLSLTYDVVQIAPEFTYHETTVPNDPAFVDQWHLTKIGAENAWDHGTGSGITVAIADSGVSIGGVDLTCRTFKYPYNAFSGDTSLLSVSDDTGHGTHVTGTVAQCTNNGVGAAGVAPDASIMPIKVLSGGTGTSLEVANGIHWAVDHGADVINLSLGRSCSSPWPTCSDTAVDSAIEYAHDAGILVVVATGNEGSPWVSSPANHPASFAVGATTTVDTIATYSNYGDAVDLVAPGGNFGDLDGDLRSDGIFQESFNASGWGIVERRGTSSAAPHVAGVAALVLSVDPGLAVGELETILSSTAVDLGSNGWDPVYGAGRVDAEAAVVAALPPITTDNTYVLGGSAAVSEAVVAEVGHFIGSLPTRVTGADRYATAANISKESHPTGADTVYVVTGERFPDALGVGASAAMHEAPVLLVTRTTVPQSTADELNRLAPSLIVVVGGTAVINDSVADRLSALTTGTVTRIAGPDRYATAAAVSHDTFSPGVDHVFVVTGETYPDGMSASPVAAALGAPVLLTHTHQLPAATRAEITRLSPKFVTIVGGTSGVSPAVETSIRDLGFDVKRVSGLDRYGTAAAISSAFFGPMTRPVILATGGAFPDALAGAAAAGNLGGPLLLTRSTSLPETTRTELERLFP